MPVVSRALNANAGAIKANSVLVPDKKLEGGPLNVVDAEPLILNLSVRFQETAILGSKELPPLEP